MAACGSTRSGSPLVELYPVPCDDRAASRLPLRFSFCLGAALVVCSLATSHILNLTYCRALLLPSTTVIHSFDEGSALSDSNESVIETTLRLPLLAPPPQVRPFFAVLQFYRCKDRPHHQNISGSNSAGDVGTHTICNADYAVIMECGD